MAYPEIDDINFYKKINNIYDEYRVPKKIRSFDEICKPQKFSLQKPQLFVSQYVNPETPYKGILVYHQIGSGKTITAIRVAEAWKKKRKIYILLPASLKGNFMNELRTEATGEEYLTHQERIKLSELHPSENEYKKIIWRSDERIQKYYNILSYNRFAELAKLNKINFKNSLLIVDEIQNMVSDKGEYYKQLYKFIKQENNLRIVLLSATPMFDKPKELAYIINLLRDDEMPIGREFDNKFIKIKKTKNEKYNYYLQNKDLLKRYLKGYVSYYRGAEPQAYPETKIKYLKCEMSDFQYKAYKEVLREEKTSGMGRSKQNIAKVMSVRDLPNTFYIGTRIVSNIVFPNKKLGKIGFDSLTGDIIRSDLQKYSSKIDAIMKKIRKNEKIFIYSGFKEYGGIGTLVKVLEENGYHNFADHSEGRNRFALWTGDENMEYKDTIRTVYNRRDNIDGSKIKIIIGSSAIKEGVSFYNLKKIIIMEPYWNKQRIAQIIGRGSRFCSHKDLPSDERKLTVYILLATYEDVETVDVYLNYLAKQKNKLVNEFEDCLKESAVDCALNYWINNDDENGIKCDI